MSTKKIPFYDYTPEPTPPLRQYPRIIFLDVDGVLNRWGGEWLVHPAPGMEFPWMIDLNILASFNHVLSQMMTETKIVVSSTWRLHCNSRAMFEERTGVKAEYLHDDWRTMQGSTGARWIEINEWLSRHPEVKAHVAIDDDGDAQQPGDPKSLVKTNGTVGLTYEQLELALRRIGYTLQGSHTVQRRKLA